MAASRLVLQVKRLSDTAVLPARATASAAGYDLCAAAAIVVPPRNRALCRTDLAIAVPAGTYGRVGTQGRRGGGGGVSSCSK